MPKSYRQGDVLFYEMEDKDFLIREEVPHSENSDIILALGEVTGHKHRVSSREAKEYRSSGRRFLSVGKQGAKVKHEEHNTLPLPQGIYEVVIEREYEIGGTQRVVAD